MCLLEILSDPLLQPRRREAMERFTLLDARIEDVLHVGASWIDHDAAVAERSRPEFHPTLEPPHDLSIGDGACRCFRYTLGLQPRRAQTRIADRLLDLAVTEFRSGIGVLHVPGAW